MRFRVPPLDQSDCSICYNYNLRERERERERECHQIYLHTYCTAHDQTAFPYIRRADLEALYVFGAGESVQLDCMSYGTPRPTIQWFRYGQNLSVFELIHPARLQAFENGSLKIHNLTVQDEGVYVCTAENTVGYDVIYVTLIYNESHLHGKFRNHTHVG